MVGYESLAMTHAMLLREAHTCALGCILLSQIRLYLFTLMLKTVKIPLLNLSFASYNKILWFVASVEQWLLSFP